MNEDMKNYLLLCHGNLTSIKEFPITDEEHNRIDGLISEIENFLEDD